MTLRELSLSSLIQAKMELLTASGDEELHDAQGPYAAIAQVDNYVKDQGTRRHLLGGGVGNFVQAAKRRRELLLAPISSLLSLVELDQSVRSRFFDKRYFAARN